MNGAVWLHSCTSSSSRGSTWSTCWIQLFTGAVSGSRPPASIAVPALIRSGDALRAVIASAVRAGASSAGTVAPAIAAGCASRT